MYMHVHVHVRICWLTEGVCSPRVPELALGLGGRGPWVAIKPRNFSAKSGFTVLSQQKNNNENHLNNVFSSLSPSLSLSHPMHGCSDARIEVTISWVNPILSEPC